MSAYLITGATTPVGESLIKRLLEDDQTERIVAIGIEAEAPRRAPFFLEERIVYKRCDLTRSRRLRRLLFGLATEFGVTAVAHLAMHRKATKSGKKVHRLNVDATRELLGLCGRHPTIERFVFQSTAHVYLVEAEYPFIIGEDHPLNLGAQTPQWVRDRVEADLTVAAAAGLSDLKIAVLRTAEVLAPNSGSQLHDYLQSRVCFRPLGYDPILNLTTTEDVAEALALALDSDIAGVYNVPALDVLPLTTVIRRYNCHAAALPRQLLSPLYRLRALTTNTDFVYALNHHRFHFGGVLDGTRFSDAVGFAPQHPIAWPRDFA